MGSVDPLNAADTIETELLLADLQQAQKALERAQKNAKSGEKAAKDRVSVLEGIVKAFNDGTSARLQDIPPEIAQEYQFLTAKPLLYVANTDENGAPDDMMEPLRKRAQAEGAGVIALCTKLEAEILELPEGDRKSYYEEAGIVSPGLARLAQAGKDLLKLICFFTAGPQETRAWLIPQGTPAVKAAGMINSDIDRGFIRAEIYQYEDLVRLGDYSRVKEEGRVTLEGKDYVMNDGDVVYFRFNV
jgi:GTP-binding protein YchF